MMPTATSRPRSRSPSKPIAIPATSVKASKTHNGLVQMSTEPVAPAKPTCDSAWPANVILRRTRKNPTAPAITAASPPAMNAVRMKSYSNIVAMSVGFHRSMCGDNEQAAVDAQYVDRRPVELREHLGRDHLVHAAQCRTAA